VNGFDLRAKLGNVAWESLGVIRSADSLKKASDALQDIEAALPEIDIADSDSANPARHQALDLENLICVARMIECAASARKESRGSHYREDFTEQNDRDYLVNFYLKRGAGGQPNVEQRPVEFTRCSPEILKGEIVIAKTAVTHSASEV
jgi:succinate dehydrogenase/fumarate reductase flavoprotein subunit